MPKYESRPTICETHMVSLFTLDNGRGSTDWIRKAIEIPPRPYDWTHFTQMSTEHRAIINLAHVKSECKCQEMCYTLGMDFPILDLVDDDLATDWLLKYFHPHGLKCPHCGAGVMEARPFRQTATSQLTVHRCLQCQGIYNLYSSTVFQQKQLRPAQAVLLLRGVCKGESSAQIAREIGLTRQTVLSMRRKLQANAQAISPQSPLTDAQTETDEMFQNAGEKK